MGRKLIISDAALLDIESIFEFGFYRFGESQATKYIASLDDTFMALLHNPALGKYRNEIGLGCRSFVHQSHVIFYDFTESALRIIRVLHSSRDVQRAFGQKDD